MAQALANGSVSIDDFVAQMGAADGAVQKAADTINSDFGTRMELMNKKFGAMGTEIGEKLLPVMELLMGWVEQHMPEIEAAVSVVFDAIGQAINWFVSNVWPGLSAALNAIWGVFQKIWPPISVLIQKVFGIISTVFKAVGALLKGDWSGAWKYFQEYVAGVLDLWRTAIEDAWNAIDNLTGGALTRIKDWVVGAWEAIAAKTTEIWTGITDWFNSTFGWIGQLFSGLDWSLPTITMRSGCRTCWVRFPAGGIRSRRGSAGSPGACRRSLCRSGSRTFSVQSPAGGTRSNRGLPGSTGACRTCRFRSAASRSLTLCRAGRTMR